VIYSFILISSSSYSVHTGIIIKAYPKLKITMTSSHLLFILSCRSEFMANSELLLKLLATTAVSVENHNNCEGNDLCCELIYLIRILSNSCDTTNACIILDYFQKNVSTQLLKHNLQSKNRMVRESFEWFLGNLYSCCGDSIFFDGLQ
jgi:hypothetical protein